LTFTGPYPTVFGGNTAAMVISNTAFSGGVTNVGTIGAGGIAVISSTLQSGGIIDIGTIVGGIKVDSNSTIVGSSGAAIAVIDTPTFGGGISNAGAISATTNGVLVSAVSAFTGGITNSGGISVNGIGVEVAATSSFAGGIVNGAGGQIAAGQFGVFVSGVTGFAGGIVNRSGGTISTSKTAITIDNVNGFTGGINNAGTISGGHAGIIARGLVRSGSVVVTFVGGISNSGDILVKSTGIAVGAFATRSGTSAALATFAGGITNSGTISGSNGIIFGGNAGQSQQAPNAQPSPLETQPAGAAPSAEFVVISNFSGGITNRGNIVASSGSGIAIDAKAHTGGSFTLATFAGGIRNTATISATDVGMFVNADASRNGSVTVSTFAGASATVELSRPRPASRSSAANGSTATALISNFSGGISNGGRISATIRPSLSSPVAPLAR
jgi:hypothetical protein